jgi:hypothetical protein
MVVIRFHDACFVSKVLRVLNWEGFRDVLGVGRVSLTPLLVRSFILINVLSYELVPIIVGNLIPLFVLLT